ncbi:metallophosphoesterase [Veillonella intestinalis]|uniref:metallophosphoesterase n=1 Tax=Veillonella intestinalis TaxID=2941341 RepID=UPI00203FFEF5|nr:metallophosphoesterase [Veillonella intestinalis]
MSARFMFLAMTTLIVLLIVFVNSYLIVRVTKVARRALWFWGLVAVQVLAIGGTTYYQLAQVQIFDTALYEWWKHWAIGSYGLLLGLGVCFIIMIPLALVVAAVNWRAQQTTDEEQDSRRRFLRNALWAVPAVTAGGGVVRAYEGAKELEVNHVDLVFRSLPEYLKGYKLAQISDVHIGPFIDLHDFDKITEAVLAEKPDRLVITGDLIDELEWLNPLCGRLEELFPKIPDGIDYILGNHEYFKNLPLVLEAFSKISMRMHRNSSLRLSGGSWPVYLAGVEYSFERTGEQREVYLKEALANVPSEAFVILLAHHPDFIENAFAHDIPVTLSGHTHGGQIVVGDTPLVPVGTKYFKGMYRDSWKYGYVNNGTGHWFPVRYNCPREITIFTFKEGKVS